MRLPLLLLCLLTAINMIKAQTPPAFNITYSTLKEKPKGLTRFELFPNDSCFYEDDNYTVLRSCEGEFGGWVVFKSRATGLRYYCAATCPVMVNKLNGSYYVTVSLDHFSRNTRILEIKDPTKLQIKRDLTTKKRPGQLMARGEDYDTSRVGSRILLYARNVYTLATFVYDGKLYHIISDTSKTYLATIKNDTFETVKKLTDYYISQNIALPRTTADGRCQLYFQSESGFGYIDISGTEVRLYTSSKDAESLLRGHTNEFDEVYFKKYNDSIIFTQPSRMPTPFSDLATYPKKFSMQLPNGITQYSLSGAKYSLFHYADGEKILVIMNHHATGLETESSCTPDPEYVLDLLLPVINTYNDRSEAPQKGRETTLFNIKGCNLLLLNIKPDNYPRYEQMVKSFRLLPNL